MVQNYLIKLQFIWYILLIFGSWTYSYYWKLRVESSQFISSMFFGWISLPYSPRKEIFLTLAEFEKSIRLSGAPTWVFIHEICNKIWLKTCTYKFTRYFPLMYFCWTPAITKMTRRLTTTSTTEITGKSLLDTWPCFKHNTIFTYLYIFLKTV